MKIIENTTLGEISQRISALGKPSDTKVRVTIEEIYSPIIELPKKSSGKSNKPSKWALLAKEIENDPNTIFDDYAEQWKKDMKEFRENFSFKHDL